MGKCCDWRKSAICESSDLYIVKFMAYHLKLIQQHLYLFSTLLEELMASKSLCVTGGFEFILKRGPEFPPILEIGHL